MADENESSLDLTLSGEASFSLMDDGLGLWVELRLENYKGTLSIRPGVGFEELFQDRREPGGALKRGERRLWQGYDYWQISCGVTTEGGKFRLSEKFYCSGRYGITERRRGWLKEKERQQRITFEFEASRKMGEKATDAGAFDQRRDPVPTEMFENDIAFIDEMRRLLEKAEKAISQYGEIWVRLMGCMPKQNLLAKVSRRGDEVEKAPAAKLVKV